MTARDDLYYALTVGAPLAEEAYQRVEAFRAEVLREAAASLLRTTDGTELHDDAQIPAGEIRRILADAASLSGPAAGDKQPKKPAVCEGFQWIGQSFATCDRCAQPAWEHAGEEVPTEDTPFSTGSKVRPWTPGEADRIRAKWGGS